MIRLDTDDTAHCRRPGVNPDAFFPPQGANGKSVQAAKELCVGSDRGPACPFLAECREYGLTHMVHGIWGGLADDGRKAERKRRRIVPEPMTSFAGMAPRVYNAAPRTYTAHGTWGAIGRHERDGEKLCDPCLEFRRAYRKAKRDAERKPRADSCALVACPECGKEMVRRSLLRHRRTFHDEAEAS